MLIQYNLRLIILIGGINRHSSPTFRFYKDHGVHLGAEAIFIKIATQVAGNE